MGNRRSAPAAGLLFALSVPAFAGATDLDEVGLKKVDTAAFHVGSNMATGSLVYIVDRTTGLCFAEVRRADTGLGVTTIPCDNLRKIPEILRYLETGELPGE